MGGSGVVRLHASRVLFLVFVNFCLTKKEKRKKRKLLPFAKVFSLANEVFFDFRESFLREVRPKNYYSRKFLPKISRFFDLAKVSAPKVRDRPQTSLLIISEFKQIYELLFPLKSLENLCFSDYFRGNKNLFARLSLLIIRSEIWRRSLNMFSILFLFSVQVRRTDKINLEASFHKMEEYMYYVDLYYKKLELSEKIDKRRVFLATDDPSVLSEARRK